MGAEVIFNRRRRTASADPGATPTLSAATLTPATGPRTGGTRVVVTGATGIDVGATLTLGGVAHGLEYISPTSFAFVTRAVAYNATGAKDLVITNPNLEEAEKETAYTYDGTGQASYTTWATFLTALDEAAEGFTALLTSTGGIVAKATKGNGVFNFPDWINLFNASTTLLTEMITAITGTAPTPQTPHASTGGLVLGTATNAVSCCGLNSVRVDGSDREMLADIIWDTVDDASMATNAGFWVGFRASGIATSSTTLIAGGIGKTTSNTYRPSYFYNQINAVPEISNGPTAVSAGAVANGCTVTCFYVANQGLNVAAGDGGANYGGCRVTGQTTGTALVAAATTAAHTSRTDLQPCWGNSATDGSNVVRLHRFKIFGDCVKV